MTIAELTTPLERRRMIEYGSDGCKVVRHWHNVRRAVGNVYVDDPKKDEWGVLRFSTFLIFPEAPDGIMFERELSGADWRTLEDMEKRNMTFSDVLKNLDDAKETGRFIGNAYIELVRQVDEQRAERYAQARLAYYERKEAEEEARREQRAAEEAEKEEERRRIDADARALYRGFADGLTALKFGKIDATLSAKIREDGKITTKREWIENKIAEGWRPLRKDGVVTYYGSRWNVKESKPKTEYRLQREGTAEFYRICKTEHDYAAYLAAIA